MAGTSFELALPEMSVGAVCVEFWFDKRGSATTNLQVVVECPTGRRNLAWQGHTDKYKWTQVSLLLQMETSYKVIFKMEKEDSSHVTGLDDVNVYTVKSVDLPNNSHHLYCEQTTAAMYLEETTTATIPKEFYGNDSAINCTFENSSCSWRIGDHSDFDWHIGDSNDVKGLSAPKSDHTNGDGRYAYIRGMEARNSSWKAVLSSNAIDSDVQLQFSFWYIMNGLGVGSLSLYQTFSDGDTQNVWSRNGRQGPDWIQAVVNLSPGMYTILFEAQTKYHYLSDLAIDDTILTNITLTTTTTPPTTTLPSPVPLPLSCNFELDTCGFSPPVTDPGYVLWERTKSPLTVLKRVYVMGDNTTGSGTFLSLRPNGAQAHRGDVASIRSPALEANTAACFRLAYIMPSTLSGTITVYKRKVQNGELHLLEHLSGYQGQHWQSLQVDLQSSDTFQIEIKGSYAGEPGAVIGVDDMSLENGPCPVTTMPIPSTTTTLPPPPFEVDPVCSDHDDQHIADMSCSFDSSACSYSSVGDKLQWIQLNDSYPRITGGKTGPYIVLDTTQLTTPHGSIAQLKSPVFNGSGICLTFWYINPSVSSNLEVLMEFISGAKASIWSTDKQAHSEWQSVALSVKTQSAYKLVFQSIKTDTYGPIGIDEINVFETLTGSASSKSTQTSTASTSMSSSRSTQTVSTASASMSPSTTTRAVPTASSSKPLTTQPGRAHSSTSLPPSSYIPHSTIKLSGETSRSFPTSQASTIYQPSVPSSGKHVTSPSTMLVMSSPKNTKMPILTKIFTSASTNAVSSTVSESVTQDNLLNSKTTKETSNESNNDKSTDNDSSSKTKALYIGLSVAVFGLCGIVLAVYLLKNKVKVSNQKDTNVAMHDIDKIDDSLQSKTASKNSTAPVAVVGFTKLDV
ncbi:MAM and LDL-receptor class A domain-containing protein 1-like [Pecten maximus]|uniref:MAM and LDL-receptor class A domain-containing protein 1-like n=1 Tax=Pecten maximus TaxID=6579 RepID=UPI001458E604|nr:MAM and LDL-receptor class A domain-containing protein 1-like [Pecten maximus]